MSFSYNLTKYAIENLFAINTSMAYTIFIFIFNAEYLKKFTIYLLSIHI
jgi:hypothetical protein